MSVVPCHQSVGLCPSVVCRSPLSFSFSFSFPFSFSSLVLNTPHSELSLYLVVIVERGGAPRVPRPPSQAPIPLRGACRSTPCSAFWHEQGNQHNHPDPQWARVASRTPRPAVACSRTHSHSLLTPPPNPSLVARQTEASGRHPTRASEASEGEAGGARG